MSGSTVLIASAGLRARRIRSWLGKIEEAPAVEVVPCVADAVAWEDLADVDGVVVDVPALDDAWLTVLEAISQLSIRAPVIVLVSDKRASEADCRNYGACDVFLLGELTPAFLQHALEWGRERLAMDRRLASAYRFETAGKLAAHMAHELNNRLSVIQSYGETIAKALDDQDEKQRVAEIRLAAYDATALCVRLQGLTARGPVALRVIDLNRVVGELRGILVSAAGEFVTVHLKLGEDAPPVRIDPFRLQEGLIRLVLDAREAHPHGGTVVLATSKSHRPRSASGSDGELEYGQIAVSFLGREAASQAHAGSAFPSDGLPALSGFIRQIGGSVEQVGEGSEGVGTEALRLLLPSVAAEAVAAEEDPEAPVEEASQASSVLVVEDDSSVLRLITQLLEDSGARVRATADGIEALRYLEQEDFDLLVTDVVMPRLGGVDLVHTALRHHADMPVLILSGYRPEEAGVEGLLNDGSCSFLAKPFTNSDLTAAFSRLLRRDAKLEHAS